MSDDATPDAPADRDKRRRVAEVFGDVLPEVTSDERDEHDGDAADGSDSDRWLRAQVPPHHG